MGTENCFMEIKGLERDADQSPACSAKNENQWLYISTFPLHVFMAFVKLILILP
jgi:hypothetical protein